MYCVGVGCGIVVTYGCFSHRYKWLRIIIFNWLFMCYFIVFDFIQVTFGSIILINYGYIAVLKYKFK